MKSTITPNSSKTSKITNACVINVTLRNGQGPKGADGAGVIPERYTFNAAIEWIVEHGKGTQVFLEKLSDFDGNRFIAPVTILDDMRFRVDLSEATSGYVDVIFG